LAKYSASKDRAEKLDEAVKELFELFLFKSDSVETYYQALELLFCEI